MATPGIGWIEAFQFSFVTPLILRLSYYHREMIFIPEITARGDAVLVTAWPREDLPTARAKTVTVPRPNCSDADLIACSAILEQERQAVIAAYDRAVKDLGL